MTFRTYTHRQKDDKTFSKGPTNVGQLTARLPNDSIPSFNEARFLPEAYRWFVLQIGYLLCLCYVLLYYEAVCYFVSGAMFRSIKQTDTYVTLCERIISFSMDTNP